MAKVLLQSTLGKPRRDPPIEDEVFDVLEISEVGKEGIEVIGVDPPPPRSVALCKCQGAHVSRRTGVANWHDFLPLPVGEEDYVSEQMYPTPTDPALRHQRARL